MVDHNQTFFVIIEIRKLLIGIQTAFVPENKIHVNKQKFRFQTFDAFQFSNVRFSAFNCSDKFSSTVLTHLVLPF